MTKEIGEPECMPNRKHDTEQARRREKIRKEPMKKEKVPKRDAEGDRRTRMHANHKTRYERDETEGMK